MELISTLLSKEDKSVNYIFDNKQESRFVQRSDDYFIVYLSSQNGCNKACRFCHLTQSGQTEMIDSALKDFIIQAKHPLSHYVENYQGAEVIHYNFMARGEPLANELILSDSSKLFSGIIETQNEIGLYQIPKFKVSTILPKGCETIDLNKTFDKSKFNVDLYYSLYSVDEKYRKRWLPKSMDYNTSLIKLKEWNDDGGSVVFHFAFCKTQNDSIEDVNKMIEAIDKYKFTDAKFNLVRYNPYSTKQGEEPSEDVIERNFNILKDYFGGGRIVPRVGFDVKASCGMFV